MKQILIFALLLVAISCTYNLTFYTGTDGNIIHSNESYYIDVTTDFSADAGFTVGQDWTFSFYFKLGQLATGSTESSGYGYLFWLENTADAEGIYLEYQYLEDANNAYLNELEFFVDGPEVTSTGSAEYSDWIDLDSADYWFQAIFVYDGANAVIKYSFNDSSLTELANATHLDFTTAASAFDTFDDVGFFDDEDANTLLTTTDIVFDDFRVFEGALTSTELDTEVVCTDAQYTAGVYYGKNCAYQPPSGDDDDSGVLIQISLLLLMIALIFLY